MALEISESEMISRFTDNMKKAADRAKDFMKSEEKDKPQLFVEFIDSLKISAGSAHQLAHAQSNPQFLGIRDTLEAVIEVGQQLPTFNGNQAGIWFSIKTSLEGISQKGLKMATSKAMTRQDVLTELNIRQKALDIPNA